MVDKFCDYLTKKMCDNNSEITEEKAAEINYGLHIMFGEVPKLFIMAAIAGILGIFKWTIICFCLMLPYRTYSGGFHLKTHIGCIIGTSIMYTGNAFISQKFELPITTKIICASILLIFSIIMIYLYAPADTEDVPVVSKKERKKRRNISFVIVTIMLVASAIIKHNIISNILLVGVLLQTISITRLAYKLTNNKYGYEEYWKNKNKVIKAS